MRTLSETSVAKVETLLRGLFPRAASMNYIRNITGIGNSSIRIICESLLSSRVETIDTTAGKMYRWRKV